MHHEASQATIDSSSVYTTEKKTFLAVCFVCIMICEISCNYQPALCAGKIFKEFISFCPIFPTHTHTHTHTQSATSHMS